MAAKPEGNDLLAQNLLNVQEMLRERSWSRDQQRKIISHSLESLHEAELNVTGSRDPLSRYQLLLCRKLVLNLMELLFLSINEEEEEECIVSIQSLLNITQSINDSGSVGVARHNHQRPRLTVADIFDIFVLARGHVICDGILATKLLPPHLIKSFYNFNEILTKAIVGIITVTTSLLSDTRGEFFGGKTWQECIRLVDDSELCLRVNMKIWQCVGDRLLSFLSCETLENELRDSVKTLLHQFILSCDTSKD